MSRIRPSVPVLLPLLSAGVLALLVMFLLWRGKRSRVPAMPVATPAPPPPEPAESVAEPEPEPAPVKTAEPAAAAEPEPAPRSNLWHMPTPASPAPPQHGDAREPWTA